MNRGHRLPRCHTARCAFPRNPEDRHATASDREPLSCTVIRDTRSSRGPAFNPAGLSIVSFANRVPLSRERAAGAHWMIETRPRHEGVAAFLGSGATLAGYVRWNGRIGYYAPRALHRSRDLDFRGISPAAFPRQFPRPPNEHTRGGKLRSPRYRKVPIELGSPFFFYDRVHGETRGDKKVLANAGAGYSPAMTFDWN